MYWKFMEIPLVKYGLRILGGALLFSVVITGLFVPVIMTGVLLETARRRKKATA